MVLLRRVASIAVIDVKKNVQCPTLQHRRIRIRCRIGALGLHSTDMWLDLTVKMLTPFLDRITLEELDAVPFGVVQVNAEGQIVALNQQEAEQCGWSREKAVGSDYFGDVCPGACITEIVDRFVTGFVRRELDDEFRVTFLHDDLPRSVRMHMYYSKRTATIWIFSANPDGSPLQMAA